MVFRFSEFKIREVVVKWVPICVMHIEALGDRPIIFLKDDPMEISWRGFANPLRLVVNPVIPSF